MGNGGVRQQRPPDSGTSARVSNLATMNCTCSFFANPYPTTLDLIRNGAYSATGILSPRGRQKRNASHLSQFQSRLGIYRIEDFFNCDGIRTPSLEFDCQVPEDLFEPLRHRTRLRGPYGAQSAANQTRLTCFVVGIDHSKSRYLRTAIDSKNSHCVQV